MKIVVDLQGAQSERRYAGIDRQTAALMKSFVRAATPKHDVWVVTNAGLGDIEVIRGAFGALLPQDRILSFAVPGPVASFDATQGPLMNVGEVLREDFLRGLNADIIWCSSLFEGWVDNSLTSIGRLPSDAIQAVTLYDLVPLSDKAKYLAEPAVRAWYFRKLSHLQRADVLFATSEYVREQAIELLNIAPERVHAISSAADESFCSLADEDKARLRGRLDISKPFVLYTGGFDDPANVSLLVRAFASMRDDLRAEHALLLAGKSTASQESALRALASKLGLDDKHVVFMRNVSDDQLVSLYNLCALFVLPSLHEGSNLPALEAMACGAPVLAANATSLPEVIGRADMLFDPLDTRGLADQMDLVLSHRELADDFRAHGLAQAKKFSWQASAEKVLEAFESKIRTASRVVAGAQSQVSKPRLAFISPLPPERTGIADYSTELLPSLERYYDIDVVVEQTAVNDPWVMANYPVRDVTWFRANAHRFDRVLYQIGNSAFHAYQLDLLKDFPGTVVLHDSFIGDLSQWRAVHVDGVRGYLHRLYRAHGYPALIADRANGRAWSVKNYPSNWEVVESAAGVIVHSQYAIEQVRRFYGPEVAGELRRVAFPKHRRASARDASRRQLGLIAGEFVVCSFGMVNPNKLSHRLLAAWLQSSLAADAKCRLVFVGANDGGEYGKELLAAIKGSAAASRIRITGFVDHADYHAWLEAADVAVQLRSDSRGETSAAVFDCMAQGLPTVVNAHATFAELAADSVYKLQDLFDDSELAAALSLLYADPSRRESLSTRARQVIDADHHPAVVAAQYRDALEEFAEQHFLSREQEVFGRIAAIDGLTEKQLWDVASTMQANRSRRGLRKLFIDVTAVAQNDLKTGIQRVTRNIANELLTAAYDGFRVELVRFRDGHYVYARDYACQLLGLENIGLPEEIIDVSPGDVFFGVDWITDVVSGNRELYQSWRNRGVSVYFLVYDLLPVLLPEFFPRGIDWAYSTWLASIASCADGIICISKTVAEEANSWLVNHDVGRSRPLRIGYAHLGAELDGKSGSAKDVEEALSPQVSAVVEKMRRSPSVLMVGTVEPRKGHRLALQAFDRLWADGHDVNLVIAGKLGWMMESFGEQLRAHPMRGERLHWVTGITDHELQVLYKSTDVLLAASEGEGFGLPIIEAALHDVPVIARDIPVFREVAGDAALYFDGASEDGLKESILEWFARKRAGNPPKVADVQLLSWRESAGVMKAMLDDASHPQWLYQWRSGVFMGPTVGVSGLVQDMSQASHDLLIHGWAQPESWGCWAVGSTAKLKFHVEPQANSELQVSVLARAFVSPSHPKQTFELHINGEFVGSWSHNYGEDFKEQRWRVPFAGRESASLELELVQRDAASPKALGESTDGRRLGLAVKEVAFHWAGIE